MNKVKDEGTLASSILLICYGLHRADMKIREEAKLTCTVKNIMFNICLFTVGCFRSKIKSFRELTKS